MCGIIGYIGEKSASDIVYNGLKRLEYRGYDSAGIAVIRGGKTVICKKEGKVEKLLPLAQGLGGNIGIGHNRWATHGAPSDINAHPHCAGGITVVHNGIIENYAKIRDELIERGEIFSSRTDSEVIPKLINLFYAGDLVEAVKKTTETLKGSYAIAVICEYEQKIVVAKYKSPVIVGMNADGCYCASDEPALAGICSEILVLQDGDIAELCRDEIRIYDSNLQRVYRPEEPNLAVSAELDLKDYPHYMLKEIHENPQTVVRTAEVFGKVAPSPDGIFKSAKKVILTGCGTAYHAALLGKRYIEEFARLPAEAETAGELRYKNPIIESGTVVFAISQSGETADTLEAARICRERGAKVVAVTNCLHSQLTRIADAIISVAAGPEICVAATKSYLGQVSALYLSALCLAGGNVAEGIENLQKTADICGAIIERIDICELAEMCARSRGVYFLGRDLDYAVALEGSLKLKEVSYVPGEGYPAGELKHGPIALIDGGTVCVFIITDEALADKCVNAVEQVRARGGRTAVFTAIPKITEKLQADTRVFTLPDCGKYLSPLAVSVALQFLAYETALKLERNPDKPRNLAKSVTVE